jgi:hypothetical protein
MALLLSTASLDDFIKMLSGPPLNNGGPSGSSFHGEPIGSGDKSGASDDPGSSAGEGEAD